MVKKNNINTRFWFNSIWSKIVHIYYSMSLMTFQIVVYYNPTAFKPTRMYNNAAMYSSQYRLFFLLFNRKS